MSTKNTAPARFRIGERVTCYRRGRWWWAEFYADGRQRRQPLSTTSRTVARQRAIALEAKLAAGELEDEQPDFSVEAVVNEYLEHLETEDRAAATLRRYRAELGHWTAHFAKNGIKQADQVTLRLVEQYRRARKPHISPATLYHETVVLKQLLKFAAERGLIRTNPLRTWRVKRPRPTAQPVFTLAQVNKILAAAGAYRAIYELLALTGLRIGEAAWLTWKDIELDEQGGGFLHVRAKPGEWKPKDGDDRKIPLHPRAAAVLAELPRKGRFVLTMPATRYNPSVCRQLCPRRVLKKLKQIARDVKIEEATLHAFRRFFVSYCANNGVEPFKLMEWLGHADLAMVLRYYKLGDGESRRAMQGVPFSQQAEPGAEPSPDKHKSSTISEDAMD